MRSPVFALTLVSLVASLAACSGSDSSSGNECPKCAAEFHASDKAGIPLGATTLIVRACHQGHGEPQACAETELAVPADSVTGSAGTDPKIDATITRTSDPFASDLQGVFVFDATWSSASRRIEKGDYIVLMVHKPDGSNVATTGNTVDVACTCPRVELSH